MIQFDLRICFNLAWWPGLSIDGPTQCHGLSKEYKGDVKILGGGFKYVLIVIPIWVNDPI